MFPFPASHAIALTQAKQKAAKAARREADAHPPAHSVRKGLLRRVLDTLVGSRRRRAERETDR